MHLKNKSILDRVTFDLIEPKKRKNYVVQICFFFLGAWSGPA